MTSTRSSLRSAALGLVSALALVPSAALSQSLADALAITYATNPTIQAQIQSLRSTTEQLAQAEAGLRPQATGAADVGFRYFEDSTTFLGDRADTLTPSNFSLTVTQRLYGGGRAGADIRRAENTIQVGEANLIAVEQDTLLQAATAYMNVVREQAVLELSLNNQQVLERQLQASRDRFSVGEITRTDVSQAESRLARAIADRIAAEGNLETARAVYERVVGQPPARLVAPAGIAGLPVSLEETMRLAEENNPAVLGALFNEAASQRTVDVETAELLPTVDLQGGVSQALNPTDTTSRTLNLTATVQLTVPLYQAGAARSQVRAAQHSAAPARAQISESRRQAIEEAISAWEALETARASIESRLTQVEAAEIALDGVEQEAQVGSRTVLDVLDAEQELLDARVSLVQDQTDEIIASFQTLAAIGSLTARDLDLQVDVYDLDRDLDKVRNRWFGFDIDEQ